MKDRSQHFPTELLLATFEYLVPEPLPTDPTSDTIGVEYIQRRNTLHNLCLVSRRFCSVAQPLLYHNLAVTGGAQAVNLLRTLWNVPALRQYARFFACPIQLLEDHVVQSAWDGWSANMKDFNANLGAGSDPLIEYSLDIGFRELISLQSRPAFPGADAAFETMMITEPELERREISPLRNIGREDLPQMIVAAVLAMQGAVEDVLLPWNTRGLTSSLDYLHELSSSVKEDPDVEGPKILLPRSILSTAKSLRLQDAVRVGECDFHPRDFPPWPFRNIARLEIHDDKWRYSKWLMHVLEQGYMADGDKYVESVINSLLRIEELKLYHSRVSPSAMCRLLEHMSNLRSLHWSILEPKDAMYGYEDWDEFDINQALLQASKLKQLESLYLDMIPDDIDGYNDMEMEESPLVKTVVCLSRFENLKHLTINSTKLLGFMDHPDLGFGYDQQDLPTSLAGFLGIS